MTLAQDSGAHAPEKDKKEARSAQLLSCYSGPKGPAEPIGPIAQDGLGLSESPTYPGVSQVISLPYYYGSG